MKLIIAIINDDDSYDVQDELIKAGYYITRLATTGGFLKKGNTTFMVGTDDEKIPKALDIIKTNSKQRMIKEPVMPAGDITGLAMPIMIDVKVGGATVFILDVDDFQKF